MRVSYIGRTVTFHWRGERPCQCCGGTVPADPWPPKDPITIAIDVERERRREMHRRFNRKGPPVLTDGTDRRFDTSATTEVQP